MKVLQEIYLHHHNHFTLQSSHLYSLNVSDDQIVLIPSIESFLYLQSLKDEYLILTYG